QVAHVERDVRETDAVPGNRDRGFLRLEMKDFEDRAAGHADPADLAAGSLAFHAEERLHAFGRLVGHANQRAAEDLPVELHELVEIRHGDPRVAERSHLHTSSCCNRSTDRSAGRPIRHSVSLMWSATRSACAMIVRPGFTAADDGKKEASTTK